MKATYGYAKQGAGYGYTQGERAERADRHGVDTDVGAGDRRDEAAERLDQLRPGRGPADRRLPRDGEAVRRTGLVVARADSAFYNADVVAAIGRGRRPVLHHRPDGPGSVTRCDQRNRRGPRGSRSITRTRSWMRTPVSWISDAEVAETPYTALHLPARRPPRRLPG